MGLSATSSQSPSREYALAADNGVGRRWRPVGDGQQARGRVSNGTTQLARRHSEQLQRAGERSVVAGTGLHGAAQWLSRAEVDCAANVGARIGK